MTFLTERRAKQRIEKEIPELRRYARSLCRDHDRADDLVQSALERGLRKLDSWQPGTNLKAWLFTILHNVWVNEVRRDSRVVFTEFDSGNDAMTVDQRTPEQMVSVAHDLEVGLASLAAEQREALLLVVMEQFSYAEAAQICGINVGTLMSRVHRARQHLRHALNKQPGHALRRVK